ncbi:BTB/POZ domain-containing protein 6-B-like [Ruditapes philippinarum]|uniref:BTB/POZ domain-containing protein 6-B-like n=1 Tax=Ruditapes philippinarum TaxID=129788 RepID=UPI00295B898F|nr:BTB/POZ domain-containing protein 6-B-like [Ruditapes philippinarum]
MEAGSHTQSNQSLPAAWQHDKALGDCMIKLYENNLWTDVKFRCKGHDENEGIHAHKIVLAARSPVFQAMFYGPCAEGTEEIVLESTEAETFDLLLRYIYMDKVTLTEGTAASVLETAHFYQVSNLVQFCAAFLATCLTTENVLEILSLAQCYEVKSLCKACCIFIDQNADDVIKSEAFLKLTEENLTYILRGDTFYADEVLLFKKAEEWAQRKLEEGNVTKNGQNIRHILGLSFFYLRLPTMTSERLLNCTRRKGYISIEEYEDIVDFINKVPGTAVTSNSCIPRLPIEEQWHFACGQVTDILSNKIKAKFQAHVSRNIRLKAIELTEIYTHLKYDGPLYSEKDGEIVTVRDKNLTLSHEGKAIKVRNCFNEIVELKTVFGQDLPHDVDVLISGSLKITCHGEEIDDEKCKVFEQYFKFHSTDEEQRVVTLEEPFILEESLSPYTFTVNLYRNANLITMKTVRKSENILTSKHGALKVKNISGNFAGIRGFCFEHISNRDQC